MKKYFLAISILIISSLTTKAQIGGGAIYSVLSLHPSAKTAALGLDFLPCFSDDITAIINNPSTLRKENHNDIGITYTTLFSGINQASLAYSHTIDKIGSLALGVQYLNYGSFDMTALDIKHSAGLTRGKNDRIDALRIAQYAQRKYRALKLYTLPEITLVKLRNWLNLRNIHIKNKVALENQLATFESDVVVDDEIVNYSNDAIAESKRKIAELEKKIESVIEENTSVKQNYSLLKSVIGIGMINAALLLCTTDNFTRFETPRQYASYCQTVWTRDLPQ